MDLLLVTIGGALGSAARYLVTTGVARLLGAPSAWGTVVVNVAGSFLIALILELSLRTGQPTPAVRLFLTTGVMGGFTTYSAFNQETLRFAESGSYDRAAVNLAVTVATCLLAGLLGLWAARSLGGPMGAGR